MEVIVPHIGTDLDALGAAVGAQVLYPQAQILLPGNVAPAAAEFLSLHRYNIRVKNAAEVDLSTIRRAIVVDTADRDRLGPVGPLLGPTGTLAGQAEIHLYDHHPPVTDDLSGTVEVREPVGSTCTLLAELLAEAGARLTPLQATAMLLGLYSDTGSLSFTNTTVRDAQAAAYLLSQGANLRAAARFLHVTLTPAQLDVLHQLQQQSRWLAVRGARIRLVEGATPEYVGGLSLVVHRLQELLPAPALLAVVRMGGRVHLVGRSEVPWVNVADILAEFGGGGHPGAAAAVVKGVELAAVTHRLEQVLADRAQAPLLARDVMTHPVKAIPREMPAREAERLMLRYGHSGLPVVDEQGRLEAVVSLRNVETARQHKLDHAPVKGIMSRRVVTVPPEMVLDEVQELMVEKDIGRVPVVEEGNLVGIISRSDLLSQLYGPSVPHWHRTIYASGPESDGAADDPGSARVKQALAAAPEGLRRLLATAGQVADEAGTPAFLVGGFVRDLLLGRPNLDIDIVVEGDGIPYARRLAAALGGKVQEVERFGTAHIFLPAVGGGAAGAGPGEGRGGQALPTRIDVATARREFYEHAAALPLVQDADLREDLYRRDFTINAMAVRLCAHGPGGLVDFFGGYEDLSGGHIRILHSLSFVEDPTRILRALRFAHRYGFRLEPDTLECARKAVADGFVDQVSLERLRNELLLILQERSAGGALAEALAMGLLGRLLPQQLTQADCAGVEAADPLAGVAPDLHAAARPWLLRLLLLLHRLPLPEAVGGVERLKLRREESQPLLHALVGRAVAQDLLTRTHPTPVEVSRTLSGWSPEGLLLLCHLGATPMVLRYWREWRQVKLVIDGHDLIRQGVAPGPAIGRALDKVLADRLCGTAPDRETQLRLALRYALEEDER